MTKVRAEKGVRPGRLTIRDIANVAGVSIATVSRVLNGRPDVAPETRQLVLEVVRKHGFTLNRSAGRLSTGRIGLVGMTVPIVHAAYFSAILFGASEALYEQDSRILLCPTLHEDEREVSLLERLMHGITDGALLVLPSESSAELKALNDHDFQFVVIDPMEPLDDGIASVSASHAAGAKAATEHLLELGHRRIGAITGPRTWMASKERISGYHVALAGAGIVPDPDLEIEADFEIEGGFIAAERMLDIPNPPSAIFCFNDNLAIGALRAARHHGHNVPGDLSVVGFDDTEASLVTPALTTVRQPLPEMGRSAVTLLTRLLNSQRAEALRVELATKLIVRESTGPPGPRFHTYTGTP